jgi:hypothetical protein
MRKMHMTFVLSGLLVFASAAFAQDGTRAIIEKAVQAQGGEAKVAALRTMRIKIEGTTDLVPGQPNLPFTIEDTWQMPNRYKTTSTFQLMGMKFTQTQVVDGDKGWIQTDGQVQDMPKNAVAEMGKPRENRGDRKTEGTVIVTFLISMIWENRGDSHRYLSHFNDLWKNTLFGQRLSVLTDGPRGAAFTRIRRRCRRRSRFETSIVLPRNPRQNGAAVHVLSYCRLSLCERTAFAERKATNTT